MTKNASGNLQFLLEVWMKLDKKELDRKIHSRSVWKRNRRMHFSVWIHLTLNERWIFFAFSKRFFSSFSCCCGTLPWIRISLAWAVLMATTHLFIFLCCMAYVSLKRLVSSIVSHIPGRSGHPACQMTNGIRFTRKYFAHKMLAAHCRLHNNEIKIARVISSNGNDVTHKPFWKHLNRCCTQPVSSLDAQTKCDGDESVNVINPRWILNFYSNSCRAAIITAHWQWHGSSSGDGHGHGECKRPFSAFNSHMNNSIKVSNLNLMDRKNESRAHFKCKWKMNINASVDSATQSRISCSDVSLFARKFYRYKTPPPPQCCVYNYNILWDTWKLSASDE